MEKLFLFLIILLTGSVYVNIFNTLLSIVTLIVLGGLFLRNLELKVQKQVLLAYFIIILSLGIILFLHYLLVPYENDLMPYLSYYIRCAIVGLFILYLKNKNISLLSLLQPTIKFVAIHALIAFILSFFVVNLLFNITTENIYTNSFLYVFFYNSSFNLFGITFYRNQGIFWEPGILQIYMNILFFISSFIYKNRRLQLLSVFLIFTTYSTTGIAILLFQFIFILLDKDTAKVQKYTILAALGVIVLPLFVLNYESKFRDGEEAGIEITSSALRMYDFLEGVNLTLSHPIAGIGLSEDTYQKVKINETSLLKDYSQPFVDSISNRRSSNSITYFLSRFGLLYSLFWFWLLYKQQIVQRKKVLFFIIILLSNLSEPLLLTPLFLLIAISGLYNVFKFVGKKNIDYLKYA